MRNGKLSSRTRSVLILLCVVVLASLGWALFRHRDPVYNGKTATEWMQIFYDESVPSSPPNAITTLILLTNPTAVRISMPNPNPGWGDAKPAIDQFGTNIVPYALRLARTRNSRLKQVIAQHPLSEKVARFFGFEAAYNRWVFASVQNPRTAVCVFKYLGPRAKCAVPSLLKLLAPKEDPNTRQAAALMLTSVGIGAQDALPDLLCYWKDPDVQVRKAVQNAVIRISYGEALFARKQPEFPQHRAYTRRSAELIWPVLARLLRDPAPERQFIDQICSFLAWNEDWAEGSGFRNLLNDPNETVRTNATNALERINSSLSIPSKPTMPAPGPILVPPPLLR